MPRLGGGDWTFSEQFTGCDILVFVPDSLAVSQQDSSSIWGDGLLELVLGSPANTHYFFVSTATVQAAGLERLDAMQEQVEATLASLDPEDSAWWADRLHVVSELRSGLNNDVGTLLGGIGQRGFAVDRNQRVRGLGSLADVNLYRQALSDAGMWPWEANLANARYEPIYLNWQAELDAQLAADEDVLVVTAFDGETTEEYTDVEVEFPPAAELAGYDTLELLLENRCPNDNAPELGNCGAWDYLGHVQVFDDDTQSWIELGRYITTYHREGRWILDVTDFAPPGEVATVSYRGLLNGANPPGGAGNIVMSSWLVIHE